MPLQVWWDRGQGVDASPDRLHYRMEAANRAEVVVVVGSADYYASLEFADEARLLYSRAVGGFANGVENLQAWASAWRLCMHPPGRGSEARGLFRFGRLPRSGALAAALSGAAHPV